jgi:hypothetical protein
MLDMTIITPYLALRRSRAETSLFVTNVACDRVDQGLAVSFSL